MGWRGLRSGRLRRPLLKVRLFVGSIQTVSREADPLILPRPGIEDLFLHITRQLIARGDQLEHERLRKARESVMLDEPDALETTKSTGKKDKTNKFGGGCCV